MGQVVGAGRELRWFHVSTWELGKDYAASGALFECKAFPGFPDDTRMPAAQADFCEGRQWLFASLLPDPSDAGPEWRSMRESLKPLEHARGVDRVRVLFWRG